MKTTLKLAVIVFVTNLLPFISNADDEGLAPPNVVANIPVNSWEQHAQGVSVALDLVEWIDENGGYQRRAIKVYIKNTSNIDKYLMDAGIDFGIQIIYINEQNSQSSLHNIDLLHPSGLRVVPFAVIKPGQVLVCTIELEQNELDLLKAHAVKCVFFISNQGLHLDTADRDKIETSPVMLVSRSFKRHEAQW